LLALKPVALVLVSTLVAIAGAACSDKSGGAAQDGCERLSEPDRSTAVAVFAQGDSFKAALNDFVSSSGDADLFQPGWQRRSAEWIAVMRYSVSEQRRLVEHLASARLRSVFAPGLADFGRSLSDVVAIRTSIRTGDQAAIERAVHRIEQNQQAARTHSQAFDRRLNAEFCNPPPPPGVGGR
jgi:hypothetical protein